jgi:4-deoxy-L-threo-5-hexosulose-uronate ketol-isomerase
MYIKTFQATHPDMMENVSNDQLKDRYQVQGLFAENDINMAYSHNERLVIGGAFPTSSPVKLQDHQEPASAAGQPYLIRRELGVFNVGTTNGSVTVDGTKYQLSPKEALYVPMGSKDVQFEAEGDAAEFYLISAAAHKALPIKKITVDMAKPLERGSKAESNERIIYQYIIPGICESCSLLVGMTEMKEGSVWNTMPPHLHDRRSEIYFYYGFDENARVFHFMGEPHKTRHLVLENRDAVISPPWSIHMGSGTTNYNFIWGMAGENLDYTDLSALDICQLA